MAAEDDRPRTFICAANGVELTFDAQPSAESYVQYISDSGKSGSVSPASDLADLSGGRLAQVGKSPISVFVDNRPDVATWVSAPLERDPHSDRRALGRSLCVDVGDRQRFCREAD